MVKVLLVDDELDFCTSLEQMLKREGYQVLVATSGKEAIKKVKSERPQLILLDIRMPKMDGIKTLEEIRKIDREALITIVSVVNDTHVAQKSMKLGAVNYITKPVDTETLKRTLKNWAMQIEADKLSELDILTFEYNKRSLIQF